MFGFVVITTTSRRRQVNAAFGTTTMSESVKKCDPVWCMVGNIVKERPYGEGGVETRVGTKHFSPGTKVYCFPPLWGDGYENIKVIGYHRGAKGRQLVVMIIKSTWVENRRAELVYKPAIISRFDGAWDGSSESKQLAVTLAGDGTRSSRIRECWKAFCRIIRGIEVPGDADRIE